MADLSELIQESRDQLDCIERGLLGMESGSLDQTTLQEIFRAAHTLKGSAGIFGLDALVSFTHSVENVLDALRSSTLSPSPELFALLLQGKDYLAQMVDSLEEGNLNPDPIPELRQALRLQLDRYLGKPNLAHAPPLGIPIAHAQVEPQLWRIYFKPGRTCLRLGIDPIAIIQRLQELGTIQSVQLDSSELPTPDLFDAELCYLNFLLTLESSAERSQLAEVFDFLPSDAEFHLIPSEQSVEQSLALIRNHQGSKRLGEMLLDCGALSALELERALHMQAQEENHRPLGMVLEESLGTPHQLVEVALRKQAQERKISTPPARLIKVEVEKLDTLIDLVGELVIAGAAAHLSARTQQDKSYQETTTHLLSLIESIRGASLGLRMVPIGDVFSRFPRVVRDICKDLGKQVRLEIEGAETEMDKSMVERIVDPLTHIIRNSLDHGIENPENRQLSHKDPCGLLRLSAWHEGGNILIEIHDDGAGLQTDIIRQKAIKRGLIPADRELSSAEIHRLIFEPGFSTAESVTNLSGRGVGMDVVRRNIEDLRGDVELTSELGRGTTLRIRLPLTLAIIDGFEFRIGSSAWVVPLDQVVECAKLSEAELFQGMLRLRDETIPHFRLRDLFRMEGSPQGPEHLLILQNGHQRMGMVVDELVGELQAVIKPLGGLFKHAQGIGGTTILGNGQIAPILDIAALAQLSQGRESALWGSKQTSRRTP